MSAFARFTSLPMLAPVRRRVAGPGPRFGAGFRGRGAGRFPADSAAVRPGAAWPRAGILRRLARTRGLGLLLRAGLMALAAAGLAAGGLEVAAGLLASRAVPGQAMATAVAAPRWSEIRHPLALYDLPGTEFSKLPASYRARRREPDGAREDVMTFGHLGDPKPFLQLSLLRTEAGREDAGDALSDALARLAGARGTMATRIRPAASVDTRLGRFEAADLLLWDRGASTSCLGFRGGGAVLRVSGFACGGPGRPMGRAALACAIDRIDLVSAGEDAPLRAVFVAAERGGGATCLGGPSLRAAGALGPAARRLGWLDPDGEMPPLRGLFEATLRQR